jgi:ADP-ribose pyrophosphatase
MSRGSGAAGELLADLPAEVALGPPRLLGKGFRRYQRFEVTLPGEHGPSTQVRDVLRAGKAAAVLPIDLARDAIVVMRQFRLAAQLANGRGSVIEIVAGHVEPKEAAIETARRECVEEIGLAPQPLIELFTYLTTPGMCDEEITLFLGVVDSSQVPKRSGAAHEDEETHPFAVSIDAALAALDDSALRDGPLIIALQWLALNRARVPGIVRAGSARF